MRFLRLRPVLAFLAALALAGCANGAGGEDAATPAPATDDTAATAPATADPADTDAAATGDAATGEATPTEGAAAAAWQPERNVEFIIPFGPGGGFDAYSRQVTDAAQQFLPDGVRIDVRNVEGAGGAVGAETLRRAEPDGHTIGLAYDIGLAVSQTLDENAEIQLQEDFAWIAGITREPYVLFATADSGITSLEDLESRTEPVRFGATGAASPMFVISVITSEVFAYDMQPVTAYGGAGDILSGATRGDIELSALEASSIAQYVEAGDVVPLLVFGEEPAPQFPDAPTINDVDGLERPILSMRPIAAPAGVDQAVVDYWEDVFLQAMETPELAQWSEEAGREVAPSTAEEVQERVDAVLELMASFRDQVRDAFQQVSE